MSAIFRPTTKALLRPGRFRMYFRNGRLRDATGDRLVGRLRGDFRFDGVDFFFAAMLFDKELEYRVKKACWQALNHG